ncbi:MAG TPA: methyl-accepting chemotaxis protein, partial [Tepidisphaeraceae bacterium]|nr:methyl-accepting chemotaxis protein [Tepidisphaeraceae bacterium]
EAGKGFAVVAEEVRNLAMRSAEAAKNTATLIEQSVASAKNGVTMAGEVARSLGHITGASDKVNGLVAEISAASQEQKTGIDQVNVAVGQMDKVTQGNAAAAEESAAASEELASQAAAMAGVVDELIALVNGRAGDGATASRDATDRGRNAARGAAFASAATA